jgi:hypothetical protein
MGKLNENHRSKVDCRIPLRHHRHAEMCSAKKDHRAVRPARDGSVLIVRSLLQPTSALPRRMAIMTKPSGVTLGATTSAARRKAQAESAACS